MLKEDFDGKPNPDNTMQHFTHENITGLFPSRINRTAFLIRGGILLIAGFLAGLLISAGDHADILTKVFCIGTGVATLVFVFIAMFRSLLMPRLRDIGLHPAWSLLIFVHALNGLFLLALLAVPSNAFAKRRYLL